MTSIFVVAVAICFTVGIFGPEVYDKKNYVLPSDSLNVTW
jgi:hypothetical protein